MWISNTATTVMMLPIATSLVELVGIEPGVLLVRGLDCVDRTPLLDLKPDRCAYSPLSPRRARDDPASGP